MYSVLLIHLVKPVCKLSAFSSTPFTFGISRGYPDLRSGGKGEETSVSPSGPYRPPGGVEEMQGGGRRVRLEWGAYITV
ncbi:hypothetical protein FHG87_017333 [Trinorchestia longiramus]|nr:hypothetical protein FHG87_017333 [Trinorchestia longiramus]